MQKNSIFSNSYCQIHEFIQKSILGDISGINEFFNLLLDQLPLATPSYIELKRIYERLATLNDPELILENLLDLINFLTFNQVKQIEKKISHGIDLSHSNDETIRLKLIKTSDNYNKSTIFKKIRNMEYLEVHSKRKPAAVNPCFAFYNFGGLVYLAKNENILIGSKRLVLEENYEVLLNENEKIEVLGLNTNLCRLMFTGSGNLSQVCEFSRSCKDLRSEFASLEKVAGLKKRVNGWVLKIEELDTMDKMFLKIKSVYTNEYFFICNGCQVELDNEKYIVKYSYS